MSGNGSTSAGVAVATGAGVVAATSAGAVAVTDLEAVAVAATSHGAGARPPGGKSHLGSTTG
jgi:hypothetical protein